MAEGRRELEMRLEAFFTKEEYERAKLAVEKQLGVCCGFNCAHIECCNCPVGELHGSQAKLEYIKNHLESSKD